jgi:hypothetical protein
VPDRAITASGTAIQKPNTLCQFHSLARPRRPRQNDTAGRRCCQVSFLGNQITRPLRIMNRKATTQASLMFRNRSCLTPLSATQRCRSLTFEKKPRSFPAPLPMIRPSQVLTRTTESAPKATSAGRCASEKRVRVVAEPCRYSEALFNRSEGATHEPWAGDAICAPLSAKATICGWKARMDPVMARKPMAKPMMTPMPR